MTNDKDALALLALLAEAESEEDRREVFEYGIEEGLLTALPNDPKLAAEMLFSD